MDQYQSVTFDPGGVTGWSVFQVHSVAMTDPEYKILDNVVYWTCGEFFGPENEIVDQMIALCEQWPGAVFTTEDFVLLRYSRDRELLSPVRINAAFQYALRARGTLLYYQSPDEALFTVNDERLKEWGYYTATAGQKDARSAVKHNLYHLRKIKEANLRRVNISRPTKP